MKLSIVAINLKLYNIMYARHKFGVFLGVLEIINNYYINDSRLLNAIFESRLRTIKNLYKLAY